MIENLFSIVRKTLAQQRIHTHMGSPLVRASAKHRNRVLVNSSMLCRPDEVLECGVSLQSRAEQGCAGAEPVLLN